MLNAIIIDNEKPAIDILKILLEKTGQINVVGSFMNAADAYSKFQPLNPDVAFVDIEMPEMSGLELAEKIVSGSDMEIIFVTAYDQYALEAFRVNALDYLLKPLSYEDVKRTIERLKKRKRPSPAIADRPADNGHVYCFGRLSVYGANCGQAVKWRTSKAEELFAFMLQHLNEEVSKWKICEALWPEYSAEKIDIHLHTTIYKMKKVLASANIKFNFTFTNGRYKLELPGTYVDFAEFDSAAGTDYALTAVSADKWEKALSLYKGDYLGENGYSWSLSKMGEYEKKYSELVSAHVKYSIKKSEYSAAEKLLREALARFPLNDDFNEMLLKLYFIKEDRTALAAHYNMIEKLYLAELGILPNSAMRDLYNSLYEL